MADQSLDEDLDLGIEQEKGSRKKIIFIALGVLLILGIGGGAAWWFLAPDKEQTMEEGQKEAQAEETQKEEKGPAIYHPLNPVFVVNLPPGGRAKMLQIGVQVLTRSPELVEFLQHNDPMIRHNLLTLFSTRKAADLRQRAGKEKLQADVLAVLQKIIKEQGGPGEAEAVYFTSFVMQ